MTPTKSTAPEQHDFLTAQEVAHRLRVHERTVRRMCDRGELAGAFRAGRSWRIPVGAVAPSPTDR